MMKYFFSLLFLPLIASAATQQINNISYLGDSYNSTNPSTTIPNTSLSSAKCLVGGVNGGAGAAAYYGLYSTNSPVSQSQYQVPVGKNFYATEFTYFEGTQDFINLGYGMSKLASEGTATPPLSVIYFSAGIATANRAFLAVATSTYQTLHMGLTFPAQSFPFYSTASASNTSVILCGLEQ